MNRIIEVFNNLRQQGGKALIPYVMGGDPTLQSLPGILDGLISGGADLIEVGVPFSDPLADGPVIQAAGQRALERGCTLDKLLATLKPIARENSVPLILMIYYNMIFRRGLDRFFDTVKEAGCAGLIIPDLPLDEVDELLAKARDYQLALNLLVAPTSSTLRITQAAAASTGFLYAVSLKGITGARKSLPPELPQFVGQVKLLAKQPVAVGFGISTPEQAAEVAKLADGIIIGSALIQQLQADPTFKKAANFLSELRKAV